MNSEGISYSCIIWSGGKMLPTSRPCQQPYHHSIMILDDPCGADWTASLAEYKNAYPPVAAKWCVCVCTLACMPHAAGNLRKRLTQKAVHGLRVSTLSSSPPLHSFPSRHIIMLVLPAEIAFCLSGQYDWTEGWGRVLFLCKCFPLLLFEVVSNRGLWSVTMLRSY